MDGSMKNKTILVCGHGPGISDAVARKFGREGFSVAIVARNAERLETAAKALSDAGVNARAFPCDLGNPDAVRKLVADVRTALGPIGVVHWNAYTGGAGDLTTDAPEALRGVLDVSVVGLITAVQASLADLKSDKGAVLVTGGGFAFYDPNVDRMASQWGAMGLAIGKAAQHKTVGLLHQKLGSEGVYVGEVVVLGQVKGTAFDSGQATLDAADIANRFWELFQQRKDLTVNFPSG
jgi:NAD(P)-dependent dehydrogenase (short-subunit alcohol dehydrogenase family)